MRKNIKKILFISPPFNILGGDIVIYLPFHLCLLASITRDAGYETFVYNMDIPPMKSEVIDNHIAESRYYDKRDLVKKNLISDPIGIWKELEEVLINYKPDVVGISSLTCQVPTTYKVAEICKAHSPTITTIVGGIHATLRPKDFLYHKDIDFVFSGEAEEGILQFLSALKGNNDFSKVEGLSWGINLSASMPIIDINSYPMMSRDLFLFPERLQSNNMGCMFTGRGCCFRCKFCSSAKLSGHRIRSRANDSIICEIEHIIESYNTNEIMFMEDTFTIDKKKIRDLCRIIKERKMGINWRCTTRIDCMDKELLETMMSAGCGLINFGIESGSQEMLDYMGKGIKLEKIIEAVELVKRLNLPFSPYFMVGFPEERRRHADETIALLKDKVQNHFTHNICLPNPGTTFFDDCIALGIIDEDNIDWTLFNPKSRQASFTKYLSKDDMDYYLGEFDNLAKIFNTEKTPGTFSPHERRV